MQLDPDAVEKMAREYNQTLSQYDISDSTTDIIDKIIILIENQLDIINYLLICTQTRYCSKILNYLKNLKTKSIVEMNKLLDRGEYTPAFRNPQRGEENYITSFARLVSEQLDVFILLDKVSAQRNDIDTILILENRAMSVISVICR